MPLWPVRFDLRVSFDDPDLRQLLVTAEAIARAIHGIPVSPAIRERLNALNIARAVRGTTGIEGARITEGEVQRIIANPATPVLVASREREEHEARNAAEAMDAIARLLTQQAGAPLTEDLIRHLHELITRGIPYSANVPGQYRSHAVEAGGYVPPRDSDEVRLLMRAFVRWLNEPPASRWHPIALAVAAHFYFISIHPFGDGNGRTARAIESFILYRARLNPLDFYSLANFYYRNRDEYVRLLDFTRFESGGDLTPLLVFAASGLVAELQEVYDEVIAEATHTAFREYAREVIGADRSLRPASRERLLSLVLGLGREPVEVTVLRRAGHPLHSLYATLSSRTLTRDIEDLERLGLAAREAGMLRARIEAVAPDR